MRDASPQPAKSAIFRQVARWLAPSAWESAAELPSEPVPWESVIEASSYHHVTPALAWRLKDVAALPKPVADYMDAILFLNRDRNRQLLDGLLLVGDRLNAAGIVPLLLKGSGIIAAGVYPDEGMRFAGDLDLLLPEAALLAARDVLALEGFRAVEEDLGQDRHHLPMMIHPELGVGIELHHQPVAARVASLSEAAALLDRAAPLALDGKAFLIPDATDRIVLAIAHGQISDRGHARGVPNLRALLDVAVHQARYGETVRWTDIERCFADTGHLPALLDTLALAGNLLGMAPPFELPPQSAAAIARMEVVLDRSRGGKALDALTALARAVPAALLRSPSRQLAALQGQRWRARLARHHPRW